MGRSRHAGSGAGSTTVIHLDVQKFFDEVPWDLAVKAVKAVTDARWVLLYVERWLAAPLEHPGGALEQRTKGTAQGSAVSPILANLFMHYAFDSWLARELPGLPIRALCRRRRRALNEQAAGRACACQDRHADAGGRAQASPGQAADRLLQGWRRRAEHEHTSFTSSDTPSGDGGPAARTAGTSPGSCLRSAPRRPRPKAPSSAGCGSTGAPTCRWTPWRDG
jgi:hypothetical protein